MALSNQDSTHGILTLDNFGKWSVNVASGLSEQAAADQASALMQNPGVAKVLVINSVWALTAQSARTVSTASVTSNPLNLPAL